MRMCYPIVACTSLQRFSILISIVLTIGDQEGVGWALHACLFLYYYNYLRRTATIFYRC